MSAFDVAHLDFNCGFLWFYLLLLLALLFSGLHFECDSLSIDCLQSPLKMTISGHRLAGHDLDFAATKALKISRLRELAIEPGRRNFQQVLTARNRVFDVK